MGRKGRAFCDEAPSSTVGVGDGMNLAKLLVPSAPMSLKPIVRVWRDVLVLNALAKRLAPDVPMPCGRDHQAALAVWFTGWGWACLSSNKASDGGDKQAKLR